jgi:hypothetical protein
MRHNDHGTTRLSTEIDRLHDRINNEYRVFSAGSVRNWSKFGLKGETERAAVELAKTLVGDDRFSSIARLKAIGFFGMAENFGDPKIGALFETTYFAGLRKAGMPEE